MLTLMVPSKCWELLSNLVWVKFFNGVVVSAHKEPALKFLYISTSN
jgi:hypothetical protein